MCAPRCTSFPSATTVGGILHSAVCHSPSTAAGNDNHEFMSLGTVNDTLESLPLAYDGQFVHIVCFRGVEKRVAMCDECDECGV
jgi:hypothetical protein